MSVVVITGEWKPYDRCPCGCGEIHQKQKKNGHVVGCKCRPCIGTRNRRKGQSAQAKVHRALGGVGPTPTHEESHGGYPISVQVESKNGYVKDTVKFYEFIDNEFFRRALDQAVRAKRIGDGSMPAVAIDHKWLIVQLNRDMDGVA